MIERIKEAMQCERRALQALVKEDQAAFVRASLPILQADPDAAGYEELLRSVARCGQLVIELCAPDLVNKDAAIQLASRIARFVPGVQGPE